VTDPEREHFMHQIQVLERRLRRSRLVIVVLAVLLAMPLVGAGLLAVVGPVFMARERAALMAAREQAEEQAARAQAAEAEAVRQKDLAEKARREAGKPEGKGKH
jgi:uncharacterized low-complexity protein